MSHIFCLGVAVQDLVFAVDAMPDAATKYRAKDFVEVGGGCAATAAVAIAQLGGKVTLGARLGDDMVGEMIVRELEDYGVDCSAIQRFKGHRSSVSAIFVDGDGERMIMNYRDTALPGGTSWLPDLSKGTYQAVLADNRWAWGAKDLLEHARACGVPGIIDAETPLDDGSAEAIHAASHVAFSAPGLRDFAGDMPLSDGIAKVAAETGAFVCVTDGAEGVWYTAPGEDTHHIAGFTVDVKDTLGAGDVWHGAFALSIGDGHSEPEAIRFANAAAALKCTRFGGRSGVPARAEVDSFLKEKS